MRRDVWAAVTLLLVVLFVAAAAVALVRVSAATERELLTRYVDSAQQALEAERIRGQNDRVALLVRNYIIAPEARFLPEIASSRAELRASIERLREVSDDTARVDRVTDQTRRGAEIADGLMLRRQRGERARDVSSELVTRLEPVRRDIDTTLQEIVGEARQSFGAAQQDATEKIRSMLTAFILSGVVSAFLVLLLVVRLTRESTRRRLAQLAAEQTTAELTSVLQSIPDAVFVADATSLHHANPRARELLHAVRPDGQVEDFAAIFAEFRPRDPRTGAALVPGALPFWQAVRGTSAARDMTLHDPRTGEDFTVRSSAAPVFVEGRPHGAVVVHTDITDQLRTEGTQRLLARAGQLLTASLDASITIRTLTSLAVDCCADVCIVVQLQSNGAGGHLELAARELRGARLRDAVQSVAVPPVELLGGAVLTRREAVRIESLDALGSDVLHPELVDALRRAGARSLICAPMTAGDHLYGAMVLISGSGRHRFDEQDLEVARGLAGLTALALNNAGLYEAARRAVQTRERVLGIVAHDLRNPLNGVMVAAQQLLRRGTPDGLVQGILTSVRRMTRLVDDLLDVARLDAGHLSVIPTIIEPDALVRAAAQAFSGAPTPVVLVQDAPPGLPRVNADPERVLQIFSNLLGNALKFTPAGGRVTIGARGGEGTVIFFVRDTGPGIPPSLQSHLFEPFWQADRRDRRGVGLGLHIARALVEAQGGHIRVVSEAGKGACFEFTLPAVLDEHAPPPTTH